MRTERSVPVAYLLWLFLGLLGVHKFYLGRPWMGIAYLCTAGLFLVGWMVDLFTLRDQVDDHNEMLYLDEEEGRFIDERDELEDRIEDLEEEVANLKDKLTGKN